MSISLPVIEGWPYREISVALDEYRSIWKTDPKALIVGRRLWTMLQAHSMNGGKIFTVLEVPVQPDETNILEPGEFLFSYAKAQIEA